MMNVEENRIAKFEKVSYEQFERDMLKTFSNCYTTEQILDIYNNIQLPKRATKGSAGYDIKSPIGFDLSSKEAKLIPTGLRCQIKAGWVLTCYPRSGLGTKYGFGLSNTCGIIDEDYYFADNEGHIFLKLKTTKPVVINAGDGIAQGIFLPYGITVDNTADGERHGGFGSTGR